MRVNFNSEIYDQLTPIEVFIYYIKIFIILRLKLCRRFYGATLLY